MVTIRAGTDAHAHVSVSSACTIRNGMQVGLSDNVDLAWLQGHLLNEVVALDALVRAGMRPTDARAVLQLRVQDTSASATVRVNLTGDATFWLNDLESDEPYKCAVVSRLRLACRLADISLQISHQPSRAGQTRVKRTRGSVIINFARTRAYQQVRR